MQVNFSKSLTLINGVDSHSIRILQLFYTKSGATTTAYESSNMVMNVEYSYLMSLDLFSKTIPTTKGPICFTPLFPLAHPLCTSPVS